jgi:hypothetical protein
MSTNPFEVKVNKGRGSSTGVLIRNGDEVIQTEFSELVPCEFPIHARTPVHVEIPPNGIKSSSPGLFGFPEQNANDGDYPHTLRFPVYHGQETVTLRAYDAFKTDGAGQALAKVPVVAIATSVFSIEDGKVAQTHSVLPIWNDGSSVLIKLVLSEGEVSEGTPNPEWHMSASGGLPLSMGLDQLERVSRPPAGAQASRFELHLTPWLLAARLLQNEGKPTSHRVWQRGWRFETAGDFSAALSRITGSLRGSALPENAA